jgi:outer membrane protein assembly factor BamB
VADNTVYIGSNDDRGRALNATTGRLPWTPEAAARMLEFRS